MSITEKAMQNRYLFRGKQLNSEEWAIGWIRFRLHDGDLTQSKYDVYIQTKDYMDEIGKVYNESFEVDPATIGQCTGLIADKSYRGESEADRLIFEGDVLTASIYPFQDDEKLNYNAVVYWFEDTSQFGYELQCVNSNKRGISHGICEGFYEEGVKWEIIGNIHDNIKAEDE